MFVADHVGYMQCIVDRSMISQEFLEIMPMLDNSTPHNVHPMPTFTANAVSSVPYM